jgi:hypothetical protein
MNPEHRKIVHDLAHKFGLKSKSVGRGSTRRPTLTRTKRSLATKSPGFDATVAKVLRGHFARSNVHDSKWGTSFLAKQRTFVSTLGISPKEGEVVGASLPEISSANKGRAMLEKMGWSHGTALGRLGNKGIMNPVPQVVKKSKTGLGL